MANKGEVMVLNDDRVYVAVGKDPNRSKSTLLWALNNFREKEICILHVHVPAKWIPLMGTKFLASQLEEHQVREYRDIEKQDTNRLLQGYNSICDEAGVQASTLYIEMTSIKKGIMELITQKGIRKLAMGAAADKHYSKNMMEPKSKKAIYVCQQAPSICHIWFICNGNLVYTREGRLNGAASSILQASPKSGTFESSFSRSQSAIERQYGELRPNYRRVRSEIPRVENLNLPPSNSCEVTLSVKSSPDRRSTDWSNIWMRSPSVNSGCSASSLSDKENGSSLPLLTENHHRRSSPPSVLPEGGMDDDLYESSKQGASKEAMRYSKAEKDIVDAIQRGKRSESSFFEELRCRNEIEEALGRGIIEPEKMKQQLDEIMEKLCQARELKQSLEKQIANSEEMVLELEQKMFSAVELLQKYKKERDDLEVECEEALQVAEELKKKQADDEKSTSMPRFFSEFFLSDIEEVTNCFDQSQKIGDPSIYRGIIRHTQVAIKMLQGPSDYQQEVSILSKLRHPNIVTLIGVCQEACALVYEYLPNGSLEDRLNCIDNTSPLSWQTRIRIAAELCSVLICLHSYNSITHGDLNPSNILLDTNYTSKLWNFRLHRFHELTPESDVHSFGIILLRLLTGKSGVGIMNEVQCAYDDGNLKDLLDPTAGDWPFLQAKQWARLAIMCCEMKMKNRLDFVSEASRVLEIMKHRQNPHYFVCPIFQEIMQDPHVAADGFTYELEAFRGWLDSGHDTSPMTNLKLPHHNLVPNRALRSAIQEWQQNK